jgi:hypothetical protein
MLALLVSEITNPRVCKIGFALRSVGWEVILLHRDEFLLTGTAASFDRTVRFKSSDEAVDFAFALRPDITHVFSCWSFGVASRLIRAKPGTVVFDDYDVMAGMVREEYLQATYPGQLELERFCLENADGLCCRALETQVARRQLGYDLQGKAIFFQDYCWDTRDDGDTAATGSRQSDGLQVVYCGNLAVEKLAPGTRRVNGFFLELAENLSRAGIHFHLYPSPIARKDFDEVFSEHIELAEKSPYFHFHNPLPPDQLPAELSRYDLGLQSSWRECWPDKTFTQAKYRYATANKIFDYFDAGLGVVVDERKFQRHLAVRVKAGITAYFNELDTHLRALTAEDLSALKSNARKARTVYGISRHAPRLAAFYEGLLARTTTTQNSQPPRP